MGTTAAEIKKRAEELRGQITADRRYLHGIPEIGMDLPGTADYIRRRLDEMGIPWKNCGGDLPETVTKDCHRTRKPLYPAAGGHGCPPHTGGQ